MFDRTGNKAYFLMHVNTAVLIVIACKSFKIVC